MSKIQDYQRFVVRMREVTNRPVFLHGFFDRGLTVEEATAELNRMRANGVRMFKYSTHGRPDRPVLKDRVMSLEAVQRAAGKGAFMALRSLYRRRMTPEAREWRESKMDEIEQSIRRSES